MAKEKELREKDKERLKKLINKHERMLFMKGTPRFPECGFSMKMVEILQSCKVDYKTFNILEDDFVREGLKIYSNWPTFPQLYVKGELIGGLDVVMELMEKKELMNCLNPPAPQ